MMSQVFHGGRVQQAAKEFGLPPESFIDFSSNANVLAPAVTAEDWEQWRHEIYRYPEFASLSEQLASFYHLEAKHLLPTAGAIEALYLSARLFAGCKVAVVEPAFSDYSRSFNTIPCSVERVLLPSDLWSGPANIWGDRLEPFDIVVLGNPNNPTGAFQNLAELTALFDRSWSRQKHWIIDEAFIEFVTGFERETLLSRLADYPSLIVIRSLTKSWRIPGLRLGFLATTGPMRELQRMQPPWSINGVANAWAKQFLQENRRPEYLMSFRRLADLRDHFQKCLRSIPGIRVHPSTANFLLLELTDSCLEANRIYSELGRRGILVRLCDSFYGIPEGRFLRVAVRTAAENEQLTDALSTIIDESLTEQVINNR
ncbi:MAG: pyridoxal phosphate-dependent class II aminotransferase [Verrucomicrobia bacterium]|nr:pyridoxal phosphate-dependent class II aminotransferase [Verrucomicrobiota bacterium]